jgi:hypothetical protein
MSKRSTPLVLGLLGLVATFPGVASAAPEAAARSTASGEDLGAEPGGQSGDGLASVEQRMHQAQSVLAARDISGKASATQQEAVDKLDSIITQLQKQCEKCGGQCSKPPGATSKPSKPTAKRGGKPGETVGVAKSQAAGLVDRAAVSNLIRDIWGGLPERQREELLQPLSDEFLPEYAEDIEEYFRSLARPPHDAERLEQQP